MNHSDVRFVVFQNHFQAVYLEMIASEAKSTAVLHEAAGLMQVPCLDDSEGELQRPPNHSLLDFGARIVPESVALLVETSAYNLVQAAKQFPM